MYQGGDKLPLLTFDVSRVTGSDADRRKELETLLREDKARTDAPVPAPAPGAAPAPSATPPAAPAASAAPAQ